VFNFLLQVNRMQKKTYFLGLEVRLLEIMVHGNMPLQCFTYVENDSKLFRIALDFQCFGNYYYEAEKKQQIVMLHVLDLIKYFLKTLKTVVY
jgi:hypothetical protein